MSRSHFQQRAFLMLTALAFAIGGCASSPEKRIEENRSLFDEYPSEVQEQLRQGRVAVGYDEDMVLIALGEPDETSTEVSEEGETVIWAYTKSRPRVSIGVGGGGYRRGGGVGGGVGIGSNGGREYTAIVELRAGKVVRARYFDN